MTDPTPLNTTVPPRRRFQPGEVERVMERVQQPVQRTPSVALEDLGRMSGEAVLTQYEAAAKAVEEMGQEVKARITSIEEALVEADRDLKMIEEAAHVIRDKGKRVQLQIEEASALSSDIRATVAEFKKKVGA
jgi:hypothetical protein